MKYVNQLEHEHIPYVTHVESENEKHRAWGQKSTVKSSGCGLCSAIMVLDRLRPYKSLTLEEAVRLSYSVEANHKAGTDYKRFAPAFAERFELEPEMTEDPERLRYCLRTGGAAVAHVSGDRDGYTGVFSHGGHYVAVVSEERDGRIAVLDPSYKEGKYEEEGRRGKVEMKSTFVALCEMQVLIDDTAERTPHYYLFWRK